MAFAYARKSVRLSPYVDFSGRNSNELTWSPERGSWPEDDDGPVSPSRLISSRRHLRNTVAVIVFQPSVHMSAESEAFNLSLLLCGCIAPRPPRRGAPSDV